MHELSLVISIFDIISEKVTDRKSLRRVYVTVGSMSGIWPDALQFGFKEVAKRQGYINASLVIKEMHAVCICSVCGAKYEIENLHQGCDSCGAFERIIESGSEFYMEALEVDDET